MPGYSYSEIIQMQNDALRRVKEMQSRAEKAAQNANAELTSGAGAPPARSATPPFKEKAARVPMGDDYMKELRDMALRASSSSHSEHVAAQAKGFADTKSAEQNSQQNPQQNTQPGNGIINTLSRLGIDSDRALLLSLLLLLSEEECDEMLLLALLYMMAS